MKHYCTRCGKAIAEEVSVRQRTSREHYSGKRLQACEGAQLKRIKGQAPRVRCACGLLHILVKGSL